MNKKLNFILKIKKNYKYFLYLLVFIIIIISIYFVIPKFFSYTPKLIQESLKKNSNIDIKNISNINYKFLPSPRLRLSASNLEFQESFLDIESAEVDIVLDPLSIINHKIFDYNKLLIKGGSSNIEINKVNQLFNYVKKNQKKIQFTKNNIILFDKNKKLFEINESSTKFKSKNNIQKLSANGLFLNHKISFILENKPDGRITIKLKVPQLDLSTNILLEKKDNFKNFKGLVKLEVLNSFLQFNLIKNKGIMINKGFIRSSLLNSSFEGNLLIEPFYSFNLDIAPNTLDIKRLIQILRQNFFLDNFYPIELIKKIDGSLTLRKIFEGKVIFKNREILLQDFKVGKKNDILFDATVSKFGKKGKIQFNISNNTQDKKNFVKSVKLSGFLIPSSSKVTFEKIIFGEEIFTEKKIKNYEKKFKSEVINNSIINIFNEIKINNFFKNF